MRIEVYVGERGGGSDADSRYEAVGYVPASVSRAVGNLVGRSDVSGEDALLQLKVLLGDLGIVGEGDAAGEVVVVEDETKATEGVGG